jgi:hypothetical protein
LASPYAELAFLPPAWSFQIQAVEILLLNRSTPLRHSSLTLSSSIHNHASAEAAALASSKKDYSFLRKTVFGDKVKKMRTAFDAAAAGGGKGKAVEQASSSSGQSGFLCFL